jgi:hypothetical protein
MAECKLNKSLIRKVIYASVLLGTAILGGCGKSDSDGSGKGSVSGDSSIISGSSADPYGSNPFPNGGPQVKLSFAGRPLSELSSSPVIAFPTPPYAIGTVNDGKGNLTVLDTAYYGLSIVYQQPRVSYGFGTADLRGTGLPDVISAVYSGTNTESYAYLLEGSSTGVFWPGTTFGTNYTNPAGFTGYRGRTETVVFADFNNDGAVDVFLPTYTYLDSTYDLGGVPAYDSDGSPPNVYNAYQSFLLLNDGKGNFTEAAVTAGISMHASISGIAAPTTDPQGNQPEGAQAVDLNMDGLIDLYVGGHMFINQGIDANGVPHFKDMASTWGLTSTVLKGPAPWLNDVLPDNYLVTDEGAKFVDWDNSGHLALLLYRWNWGPAHGPRLFEFNGSQFTERFYALSSVTPTCQSPPSQQTALFWSSRPLQTGSLSAGINGYDLDNDGLDDVVVSGANSSGSAVFYNYGCGFVEVSAGDLAQVPGGNGGMALADFDGDGKIDIIYPTVNGHVQYVNTTQTTGRSSFTVEVLGPNGEHNQYGRVIQVLPPGTSRIFTRAVDSGSGYLTQNQYPILVGTPFSGAHTVKVYYAPLTACTFGGPPCKPAILMFSIQPGQRATTYAPTSANPNGSVVLSGP